MSDPKFKVINQQPHHKLVDTLVRIVDVLYFDAEENQYDPQLEWTQDSIEEVNQILIDAGYVPTKIGHFSYQNLPSEPVTKRFMVAFDGYPPKFIDVDVPPSFACANDDSVEWFRQHRFSSAKFRKQHGIDMAGSCWITTTCVSGLTGKKR